MNELPIFPLATVLFPGAVLPLHIFEDRYKAMMQHAIDHSGQFGLSYREDAAVARETLPEVGSVGCVAKVKAVIPLEEGRMNILTIGLLRYHVVEFLEKEPFLIARISALTDDIEPDADLSRLQEDTREMTGQFLKLLQTLSDVSNESNLELPENPEALSMIVSSTLPIEDKEKQRLLEMTSTRLRLSSIRHYLLQSMARLQGRVKKHEGARRNGHGEWRPS
ncbi:MAG TPA: LON peptidase substrate-binding domain-containing protein [Blastocatellia bacterium]